MASGSSYLDHVNLNPNIHSEESLAVLRVVHQLQDMGYSLNDSEKATKDAENSCLPADLYRTLRFLMPLGM